MKSIVTAISEFKGLSVDNDKQKNFLTICAENLIKTLDNLLSKPSAADSDVSKISEVEVIMVSLRLLVLLSQLAIIIDIQLMLMMS